MTDGTNLIPDLVKEYDTRIILDEKSFVLPGVERWAMEDVFEPLGVKIQGWTPHQAEMEWTSRLLELVPWERIK
jgi:hypothetical protein